MFLKFYCCVFYFQFTCKVDFCYHLTKEAECKFPCMQGFGNVILIVILGNIHSNEILFWIVSNVIVTIA